MTIKQLILITAALIPAFCVADTYQGNITIQSFSKAKKHMQRDIYTNPSHMETLYCGASFDKDKYIELPQGFTTEVHKKRTGRWEAEHIIPAENFGRVFIEWREGHAVCVDRKDKPFKGRKCAEKANKEYRLMQSDLYNLYPAIGAVNATRQNYNFVILPDSANKSYRTFGSCEMIIDSKGKKAQPPERSRGIIARTYMYFEAVYPKYKMSGQQRRLMEVWDKTYPVTQWECERSERIKKVQGNHNPILLSRCTNISLSAAS
ncbi:endonuclease [Photobacterium leiognathi]|uniref:Endonuclease I n=1 Tax=Photobacterium leiognathi TaxID=553611 RepID=A0A2T3M7J7_PHOLE|nr:endonuclease [Photobacterium leiognathi]PSV88255.1 endonuclease I [Photobacterium leiognathi]